MSLRDAGLVTSTRGAHGGYELTRTPADIRMSEILRALEGPIAPMICASDDPEHATTCDRSARCTVNLLWVRVRDAIVGALDRAGWDGFYDLEIFSDNGTFGNAWPDSLWDVPGEELARRGKEAFERAWIGGSGGVVQAYQPS